MEDIYLTTTHKRTLFQVLQEGEKCDTMTNSLTPVYQNNLVNIQ